MTPQLFRQLTVKINMDERPHDIESPRLILNHHSADTTRRSYAGQQSVHAFRRYDEILAARLARSSSDNVLKRSKNTKKVRK